jgi:hypothetical protein
MRPEEPADEHGQDILHFPIVTLETVLAIVMEVAVI